MTWGKQHRYCPNCGKHLYDSNVDTHGVKPLCCSKECRAEWENKYVATILGNNAELKPDEHVNIRGEVFTDQEMVNAGQDWR